RMLRLRLLRRYLTENPHFRPSPYSLFSLNAKRFVRFDPVSGLLRNPAELRRAALRQWHPSATNNSKADRVTAGVRSMAEAKATRLKTRPLSPHLQIYKPMLTMMMSIVHRITGGALYFGLLL